MILGFLWVYIHVSFFSLLSSCSLVLYILFSCVLPFCAKSQCLATSCFILVTHGYCGWYLYTCPVWFSEISFSCVPLPFPLSSLLCAFIVPVSPGPLSNRPTSRPVPIVFPCAFLCLVDFVYHFWTACYLFFSWNKCSI